MTCCKSKTRRINFYGGAGCGKSTIASMVFSELKMAHYSVELVSEYIKSWAYENRQPVEYDQVYVYGKQLHREHSLLKHIDCIVTDSPLFLNNCYAKFYQVPCFDEMISISKQFELDFPSLNLFLDRTVPFRKEGRYGDETQARDFDEYLKTFLQAQCCSIEIVKPTELDRIMSLVRNSLDCTNS